MSEHAISNAKAWLESIVEQTNAIQAADLDDDHGKAEALREEIEQEALSVQVRGGWYSPGDEYKGGAAEEYEILLSTGGPALRIYGELDQFGQPTYSRLQWQDWGTPWTNLGDMTEAEDRAVDVFAGCYYFGEG